MNKQSFKEEYKTPTLRFIALQAMSLIAASLSGGGNFGGADEDDYGDF